MQLVVLLHIYAKCYIYMPMYHNVCVTYVKYVYSDTGVDFIHVSTHA